jgi:hypothetical protein
VEGRWWENKEGEQIGMTEGDEEISPHRFAFTVSSLEKEQSVSSAYSVFPSPGG